MCGDIEAGIAMPYIEKWRCERTVKLVEREAFIDSMKVECRVAEGLTLETQASLSLHGGP